MRSELDQLLTERSLRLLRSKQHKTNSRNSDSIFDEMDSPMIKNMCAKVSSELIDRLDETCALLDISKREFIETAVIHALNEADKIIENEGVFEKSSPTKNQTEV